MVNNSILEKEQIDSMELKHVVDQYDMTHVYEIIDEYKIHPDSIKNTRGLTILGRAIIEQDSQVVENLLKRGASPHEFKMKNKIFNPLKESIVRNTEKIAIDLLNYGAIPNQTYDEDHCLFRAIDSGLFETAQMIINQLPLSFINNQQQPVLNYVIPYMVQKKDVTVKPNNIITSIKSNIKTKRKQYVFSDSDIIVNLLKKGANPSLKDNILRKTALNLAYDNWFQFLTWNPNEKAIKTYQLMQKTVIDHDKNVGYLKIKNDIKIL